MFPGRHGTTATYSYDNALRLTQVRNQQGSSTISSHSYSLDAVGNRTRLDEEAGAGASWAWGNDFYGQLGDGTATARFGPVQVKGEGGIGNLTGVSSVAAGEGHSLALKGDGTVWAWGGNGYGQLGDGTTMDRSTPVQVKGPGGTG